MYGKVAVAAVSSGTVGAVGALASTGVPLWQIALAGVVLVATGAAVRNLVLRRQHNT